MPASPQPDPIDTSRAYSNQRKERDDWDATAATEGGARSSAQGSTIYSDRQEPPALAHGVGLAHLLPPATRRRLERLWARVGRVLGVAGDRAE